MILVLTFVLVIIGSICMFKKRKKAAVAIFCFTVVFILFGSVTIYGMTVALNQLKSYENVKQEEILAEQNAKIKKLEEIIETMSDDKPKMVDKLKNKLENEIKANKEEKQRRNIETEKNTYLRLLWPLYKE